MTAAPQKAFLLAFSILALLPDGGTGAQPPVAPDSVLARLHAADVMVEAVGFRLATANAALCRPVGWDPGFAIHTLEQYQADYRIEAAFSFRLNSWPTVMSIAPGSPAAGAGLNEGDALVAVGGQPLPEIGQTTAAADFTRTAAAQHAIDAAFAGGAATLTVLRTAQRIDIPVHAAPACRSIFQVVPEKAMNGAADGDTVQVSATLVALAQTPDELAGVLAHELAHNILHHRERLDALHVARGLLAPFGRNARLIRGTEIEADRLSLYLVARAGYSVPAALAFWVRLARAKGGIALDPTHPLWHERIDALQHEAARIAAGIPTDPTLPPELTSALALR